jgi:MauM/NapG family ferredoxin protein
MGAESGGTSDRRRFFREAVGRTVGPLADYIEQRFDITPDRSYLRPPGAIDEQSFLDTCYRCGSCIDECPVNAIFALDKSAGDAAGTPVVDPDRQPCMVCDGLKCSYACPSGALLAVSVRYRIRMGLAEVYHPVCLRTQGEECTICVDQCPLGATAIGIKGAGPPEVLSPGCIGCGVCQFHCPTSPKAITIKPV